MGNWFNGAFDDAAILPGHRDNTAKIFIPLYFEQQFLQNGKESELLDKCAVDILEIECVCACVHVREREREGERVGESLSKEIFGSIGWRRKERKYFDYFGSKAKSNSSDKIFCPW